MLRLAGFLALGLAAAGAASAQSSGGSELTAEEMRQRFENQLTRGLEIVSPESDAVDEAQQEAGTDDVVVLAPEDQVNIQIVFDFDSATLRDDQKPKLTTLCDVMKTVDAAAVFRVIGHTDAKGPDSYNLSLSQLRAEEVKRYLVNDCGIAATRLETVGAGERNLLDPDDPDAEINRRVEFQAMS